MSQQSRRINDTQNYQCRLGHTGASLENARETFAPDGMSSATTASCRECRSISSQIWRYGEQIPDAPQAQTSGGGYGGGYGGYGSGGNGGNGGRSSTGGYYQESGGYYQQTGGFYRQTAQQSAPQTATGALCPTCRSGAALFNYLSEQGTANCWTPECNGTQVRVIGQTTAPAEQTYYQGGVSPDLNTHLIWDRNWIPRHLCTSMASLIDFGLL
ncbi:uncharacterized protein I303_108186 [Kwoniella dejecticola CBS 10117]|uniref:Uncharacterized protein n=1 Tax=Kwoniella dejecticola CBS 10117 TaxID=1296121 RepID=A0A1A5ZY37_9TREE|nr:uncharacterized protein I303_07488 [Kwoniella dejecticola CBS 10117]OBR82721.1 hypothetical protein I303_07488 [Kwoniella dejecticola CBS 10117]